MWGFVTTGSFSYSHYYTNQYLEVEGNYNQNLKRGMGLLSGRQTDGAGRTAGDLSGSGRTSGKAVVFDRKQTTCLLSF